MLETIPICKFDIKAHKKLQIIIKENESHVYSLWKPQMFYSWFLQAVMGKTFSLWHSKMFFPKCFLAKWNLTQK